MPNIVAFDKSLVYEVPMHLRPREQDVLPVLAAAINSLHPLATLDFWRNGLVEHCGRMYGEVSAARVHSLMDAVGKVRPYVKLSCDRVSGSGKSRYRAFIKDDRLIILDIDLR